MHYKRTHSVKNSTLNIRLNDEQLAALREIAKKNGTNVSQLVRWSVDALIRYVEHHDGRLILPIDFSEKPGKTAR